jgi:hypothetical protein
MIVPARKRFLRRAHRRLMRKVNGSDNFDGELFFRDF